MAVNDNPSPSSGEEAADRPAGNDGPATAQPAGRGRSMWVRVVLTLAFVAVFQSVLALALVSSSQDLVPRNMPVGVTGPSPVTAAVQSKLSLVYTTYANESDAMDAVNRGEIYGAYIPGSGGDTLIVVPQKSFFSWVILEAAFKDAATQLNQPLTVDIVKPLPLSDRLSSVVGLLFLPLLIGGLFSAMFVLKATGTAAARWRVAILVGYALVGALLTDIIAGPLIGAYTSDSFWPLYPCFVLVIAAIALATAAIQRLTGRLGTLIALLLFLVLGGASAGGAGLSLLPVFWQNVGFVLPPQQAVELIRNTLYFGGNSITAPIIVLGLWTLAGAVVISFVSWFRDRPAAAPRGNDPAAAPRGNDPAAAPRGNDRAAATRRKALTLILGGLATAAIMQCLFSTTYMSSAHSPVANEIPVGTTADSPLLTQVQAQGYSMAVTQYPSESAMQDALDQGELYGALVPGPTSSTLTVVGSRSAVAPLDLVDQFERAAATVGQQLQVKQYSPTPLPPGDPYGLVPSIMLVPLLIGGYVASTMLMTATSTPTAPWRVATLFGFAIGSGLLVNLVVGPLRGGYPPDSFWLAWAISALIILAVALFASVLQKLLGPIGTLLTTIIVILFGNPSSGGANGVPYLTDFWRDIGPYLPPRNGYLLLHDTIYFNGSGTTPYLLVLLGYVLVAGIVSSLLGWFRTPRIGVRPDTEVDAAAATNAAAMAPP